jgi:hypothetical protein
MIDLMVLIKIVIGIGLLLAGRRLFWLLIGGVGFIAGLGIAAVFFHGDSSGLQLIVALVTGGLGVLLAIFIQRSAVWLIGFIAGGFLVITMIRMLAIDVWFVYIVAFLMGGFLGALLTSMMFELALVLLSSAVGSILITESLIPKTTVVSLVLMVVLFVLGVVIQNIKRKAKKA